MPGSDPSFSANARVTLGLLVAIGLPSIMGFYWLGQLSEVVKNQGVLLVKLDGRIAEFDMRSQEQAKRDAAQDNEMAKFRNDVTAELGRQTALLARQEEIMRAIREMIARPLVGPGNGNVVGPR